MFKRLISAIILLIVFLTSVAADELPLSGPHYSLEPCCEICPAAKNPANYTTALSKEFKILIEGKENWLFRSNLDLLVSAGPQIDGAYQELKRFSDALKSQGVTLVMVIIPTRGMLHSEYLPEPYRGQYPVALAQNNYRTMINNIKNEGIIAVDLSTLFNEQHGDFFFKRDHHWTPYGARLTADLVYEEIKKLEIFKSIRKIEYKTYQSGIVRKTGTHQLALKNVCGFDLSDQVVEQFITEPVNNDSNLFEEARAEITLVGTSNSSPLYNFAGHLQQALQADIYNRSQTGGALTGALTQHLPSDDFQNSTPKILIWEFPGQYTFDSMLMYRQLIPLSYNGCKNKTTLLAKESVLNNDANEILFNDDPETLFLSGRKYVIDLQFSDTSIKKLDAAVWYYTGRKERVQIQIPARVNNQGRFVFELSSSTEFKNMNMLSVEAYKLDNYPKNVSVKASLCEME